MSDATPTSVSAEAARRQGKATDSPQRPLSHTTATAAAEAARNTTPLQLRRSSSSNSQRYPTMSTAAVTTVPLRWNTPHRPPSMLLTERRLSTSLNWPAVHRSFSTPRTQSQRSLSGRPEEAAALLRQRGRSPGGGGGPAGFTTTATFDTSVTSAPGETERGGERSTTNAIAGSLTSLAHGEDAVVLVGGTTSSLTSAPVVGSLLPTNPHALTTTTTTTPRPQSRGEGNTTGADSLLHLTPTGALGSAVMATPQSGSSIPTTTLCTPREALTTSPGPHALPAPVEAYEADAAAMTRDSLEQAVRNLRTDVRVLQTNVLRTRKTLQELQRGLRQNYSAVEQDQEMITNTFLRMLDAASERRRRLQLKLQSVEKEKAAKEEQLMATLHNIDQLQAHLAQEERNIQTRLQQQLHQVQVQRRHLEGVLEAQSCSLQELERLVNEVQKMNETGTSGSTLGTGEESTTSTVVKEKESAVAGATNEAHKEGEATAASLSESAEVATTDPLTLIRFLEQEIDAANAMRNEAIERAKEYGRRKERLEQRLQQAQQTEAKEEQVVCEMREALQCTANAVHEVNASRHFALEIESERRLNTQSGRAALSAGPSGLNESGPTSARVPAVNSSGHLRSESMSTVSSRCLTPHATQASVPVFVTGSGGSSNVGANALATLSGIAPHSTIAGLLVGTATPTPGLSAPPITGTTPSIPCSNSSFGNMNNVMSGANNTMQPQPRSVSPHLPSYSPMPCPSGPHNNALGSFTNASLATTPPQSSHGGSEGRLGGTAPLLTSDVERVHVGSTMSVQDTARMSAPRPLNSLETTPVKFAHVDPAVVPPLLRLTGEDKPSGAMASETTAPTSARAM